MTRIPLPYLSDTQKELIDRWKQCTFSLAPAADCSRTSSSGIPLSTPSNGIHTPAPSSGTGATTVGSQACTCTRETFGCSIHPPGPGQWIAFMQDSLVQILASLDQGREPMGRTADYTAKSSASLTWLDRHSSSWRTHQLSFIEDMATYSGAWPRAGMMRDGQCWPLKTLERPTSVSVGGALRGIPTPTKSAAKQGGCYGNGQPTLASYATRFPTPTVCGNYNRKGASAKSGDGLATVVGGALNPEWTEWLMGWPIGHTELNASATAKFRSARRQRGKSSGGREP